jgi:hypothetical protein
VKQTAMLRVTYLVAWLTCGCDEPLKSVELVAEPRVLGARVEVAGDPERAAPAPGETATISLLVAAPQLQPSLGFALAVCAAAPRRGGRAACVDQPFALVSSAIGQADTASIGFDVPEDLDPSGRLALLGIICPAGSPRADGASCDGDSAGTPVQLELELAHDGDVNANPELDAEHIFFDDAMWPDQTAVDGDCAGLGFVEVAVGSEHRITVQLDESDRDPLPRASKLDPSRESLQLAHFATAGDLSRAFDTIAWDTDELRREVTWTAPQTPGLTRFWIVLRDFRGGSAFVERSACVQ